MRYNRDRAHGRLLIAAALPPAPCEFHSSRLVGLSSHPTSERTIQTGQDQTDAGRLHTTCRNQRTVNSLRVRGAARCWGSRADQVLVAAKRPTLPAAAHQNSKA